MITMIFFLVLQEEVCSYGYMVIWKKINET